MKKAILICFALLLTVAVKAQTSTYQLKINLTGIKTAAKVYLVNSYGWSNSKTIDSAILQDGQCSFSGKLQEPQKVNIVLDHTGKEGDKWRNNRDVLLVFLEPANIQVTGTDSVSKASITGSQLNLDYQKYYQAVLAQGDKGIQAINAAYYAAKPEVQKDKAFQGKMLARFNDANKQRDSLKLVYIAQNPDAYLSLFALAEVAGNNPDVAKLIPVYKSLSSRLRQSPSGKNLALVLDDNSKTSIGAVAPDFTQADVNGKPVSLSGFRGKYVLLDFWASWCGPCRAENPNVVKQYEKYKNKNFTVLGVSLDQSGKKDAWLAAIKADKLPWTQVSDLQSWNNAAARLYNIRSIPQNFLIDPQGKIVAKNLRGDALGEKLQEVLNK